MLELGSRTWGIHDFLCSPLAWVLFAPRSEKEAWIRAKYVEKKFITKFPKAGVWLGRAGDGHGLEKPPKPFLKPKPPRQNRGAAGMERAACSKGKNIGEASVLRGAGMGWGGLLLCKRNVS